MENSERTVSSVCGSVALEGYQVQQSVRDSIARCLRDETVFDFAVVYVAGARAGYRNFHRTEVDADDPFLYQYSCTMVNRLNIRDEMLLASRIRDVSALRLAESERYPIIEKPNLALLKKLHALIYGDIFSWAGELRTTESDDPLICRTEHIESSCNRLMKELEDENYLSDLSEDEFSSRLAHYLTELHIIVPFRYGSDLTARAFANYLAIMNGYYLDYSKTCKSLMDIALRYSPSDESHLKQIISGIISVY